MGALLITLGVICFAVAVVMLIIKAVFKKGWGYGMIGTLAAAALVLFIVGIAVSPSTKEGYDAGKQAASDAKNTNADTKPQSSWNTEDLNAETNGNISTAVELLKVITAEDAIKEGEEALTANVMKSPWKYYGKIVKLAGEVGIAQEYPPGSDVAKAFGNEEVGEFVLGGDDLAIVDYMHMGSSEGVNVGDSVEIYGYPVGQIEVDNKLGGTTTQLVVVGKAIKKI